MEIKVKPEQLEQIAKNISEMQTHSQTIQQNLNQSMFSIQMQWQGATSQHFYGEYMRSMRLMESYIRNLQVTEKELRRIAQKFRQADEEYQKKQNEKLKETHKTEKKHEKSWWEKGVEGAAEFIGVNDAIRAVTGKDPITGKELSSKERLIAAGWTLLNFVPVGKVASLAGKGIKYVASSFGKTIVKAGKRLGEGVTMVAGKAGKAAVDGIKTASHKVTEGVNFVASTAKGFADKIGSLWNKGATTVKTTFLQGNEKIQHAVKTLLEYKWIPGLGKAYVMPGVGMVREMGQHSLKDAYQYMKSVGEKGVKGTGEVKHLDDIPRIKEIEVKFNYKTKFDSEEFARQLKDQEKGMNELTVHEYRENRNRFIDKGRAIEGNAYQQAARERALRDKIDELFEQGLTLKEAKTQANEWMKTQAALHNPDQVAGGRPEIIGGMGDKRVNFSIGSQWRTRIKIVDKQIEEIAKNMTSEQLKNTYLNVKLTH
ncbi:TPA: WXG100 family type VII secretion target [Bacillus thuringiensis]|uniref:WXG100 family type VII secretion target n=1 Tax=Bacillus TaxID=1386 RepID=UPI00046985BF|nr:MULTISPECIES: WXG100 family type VII secretion target [Bacillus]MCU4956017.1 WXG100 family type VII secretion target [Bacillus cereus]MED3272651.1 WXG100 family type VII secretion target [Bacillus thuringiensis]MED3621269.1 WXG100 family type VII secretion target [Bacillus thuringiensis]HDR3882412.1 WXG100 family type VII secretion target [Bacillus cereus]HDX9533501.1 WXG100 family type VII secretion target [Bacillus thuringiensis]